VTRRGQFHQGRAVGPGRRIVASLLWLLAGCDQGINISKLSPDAHLEPTCEPGPELQDPACDGLVDPTRLCRDPVGDWSAVVSMAARYRSIEVKTEELMVAAAAVDWEDSSGNIAGFIISLPTGQDQVSLLADVLVTHITSSGAFKKVRLVDAGREVQSHDGYPMVSSVVLELTPGSSTELYKVRERLYPALLGLDIAQFSGLPKSPAESSDAFKLVLSAILRPDGRALVLGAVATLDSYTNLLSKSRLRAHDLAGGTMVAGPTAVVRSRCESFSFTSPGQLDMLWVVDGSDMGDVHIKLHGAAVALWNRAHRYGLDLRLAVVDMGQTKEIRLCSPKPSAECPAPGVGHFFGAEDSDLACFQACLLKPSGTRPPTNAHDGLQSAKNTLQSLLARADGDPHKLRKGVQVALVLASDVEDGSVAQLFGGQVPDPLSAADKVKVASVVKPLLNLLSTSPGSELIGTRAFALVADPSHQDWDKTKCGGRRGTGYIELVAGLGGQHDLICRTPAEMDTLLESKIDELAPLASQLVFEHQPAAATLKGTLNGSTLFRSLRRGFDYCPEQNALVLRDLEQELTSVCSDAGVCVNRIEIGYVGW